MALELGVDEITLVLQSTRADRLSLNFHDWINEAEILISVFSGKADFYSILGARHTQLVKPAGYEFAYAFGDHVFYLAVAYHGYKPNMGVCVKFSAQALAYYLENAGLHLYEFLQLTHDDAYSMRLSRIDLVADFIDEPIYPTDIYSGFISGKLSVFRKVKNNKTGKCDYRTVPMKLKGFAVEDEISKVYIGSEKSSSRLRIYDKRIEQIQRKGTHYDKALRHKSWVRFECAFRNEYAHQLTDALLRVQSDDEMMTLVAASIAQKYRIMDVVDGVIDGDVYYTEMLLDAAHGRGAVLESPISRNFDIMRNLTHLFFGSGTISTLYKVEEVWGDDALNALLDYMYQLTVDYQPNADCRLWLAKSRVATKYTHPSFTSLLNKYFASSA